MSFLERIGDVFDSNPPIVPQNVEARCVACLFKLPNDVARIPGDTTFGDDFKPNRDREHVVSADSLQKSIQRGCQACAFIGPLCTSTNPQSHLTWQRNKLSWAEHNEHGFGSTWSREVFLVYTGSTESHSVDGKHHPFTRTRLPVGANTKSAETTEKVKGWINDCLTKHSNPECEGKSETRLPERIRILEIEDHKSARVRLIEGMPKAKFAALSHRWGPKTENSSLTTAKLNGFRKEVPQSSLYQLLRDAISVAGELGLKYIWIDCLCIAQVRGSLPSAYQEKYAQTAGSGVADHVVQDDPQDWVYQVGNMATIYAGAFITISGTGCIDINEGLFKVSSIAAHTQSITNTLPCPIYFGPKLDHPSWPLPMGEARRLRFSPDLYPLVSRGWAYQERILSKRIVHFTQQEVIWECGGNSQCECGYYTNQDTEGSFLDLPWRTIVAEYSRTNLTNGLDRLPAISGIAKVYAERHSYTYLAGLWKETIAIDLLWTRRTENLGPRLRPLLAPTWSWASSGPSGFLRSWTPIHPKAYFQVKEYEFQPVSGGDDYSRPVKARLHVEGLVLFGTVMSYLSGSYSAAQMEFGGKKAQLDPDYDISATGEDHIELGTELLFLLMEDMQWALGIVLRCKNEERNEYERIGVIDFFNELACSWALERAKKMNLILI